MKVAVIGTGYVGLVAGACLAETGNDVICVDIDSDRIEGLKNGIIPIYEPGLAEIVHRNYDSGRLQFTLDTADAVSKSLVIFLAVPTPMDDDGSADLQYMFDAARQAAVGINEYKIIVDKSTVPVGTAAKIRSIIAEITDQVFDVVSIPEFLKEGNAVEDYMKPDRIVIGCDTDRAEEILRDLNAPFVRTGHPIIVMRVASAELTKYAANAFLATKISYINEIARLADQVGADINDIRRGIGSDKRIGSYFLFPGLGYGGSCFPKDLNALSFIARSNDVDMMVVRATIESNEEQKRFMPKKIIKRFGERLDGLVFALWGLAFKANTDDVRDSPAMPIIDTLLNAGASVRAYDPQAMQNAKRSYNDRIVYAQSNYDCLTGADALVVVTEWNEFRRPDFERMQSLMRQPVVFDGRNLFDKAKMTELGFEYYSVGQA
ncbi:MAG: UDP-glucose/GDP-mannose dehydrogenase family protein [Candidatus Electryoneaceae bacterium]|nr:UDP-glucose/GDP-mannose dehydrogenase family protein [Candidatus Electryoneaceae bacterium]